MIKYALICVCDHAFESWFHDSTAYDSQAKRGFVTCPRCHSPKVSKAIMAPAIATRRGDTAALQTEAHRPAEPVAILDEREIAVRSMIRDMRQHIAENAENVGPRFAQTARAMHDGEIKPRAIVGEATLAQVRDLIEDGIAILPVPVLPEERH